jgi:hypothetical protein
MFFVTSIILFFRDLFSWIPVVFLWFHHPIAAVPKTLNPFELYIEKQKSLWNKHKQIDTKNQNISDVFYDKPALKTIMQNANNEIESIWKQRILFENTPRGNVILFFDPYRFGFIYYTDTSTLSYTLLNAVAMKYVTIYKCFDLFMDNGDHFQSPFLTLYGDFVKDETPKQETPREKYLSNLLQDGPFLKRKKVQVEESKVVKEKIITNSQNEEKDHPYHRNKFIRLGKIYNFSFLKKEVVPLPTMNVSDDLISSFTHLNIYNETPINQLKGDSPDCSISNVHRSKETFNYGEYKNMMKKNIKP